MLTAVSNFGSTAPATSFPNHFATGQPDALEQALPDPAERAAVASRAGGGAAAEGLPVEAIVRGYLIGSGWKDISATVGCAVSRCRRDYALRSGCRNRCSPIHQGTTGHMMRM